MKSLIPSLAMMLVILLMVDLSCALPVPPPAEAASVIPKKTLVQKAKIKALDLLHGRIPRAKKIVKEPAQATTMANSKVAPQSEVVKEACPGGVCLGGSKSLPVDDIKYTKKFSWSQPRQNSMEEKKVKTLQKSSTWPEAASRGRNTEREPQLGFGRWAFNYKDVPSDYGYDFKQANNPPKQVKQADKPTTKQVTSAVNSPQFYDAAPELPPPVRTTRAQLRSKHYLQKLGPLPEEPINHSGQSSSEHRGTSPVSKIVGKQLLQKFKNVREGGSGSKYVLNDANNPVYPKGSDAEKLKKEFDLKHSPETSLPSSKAEEPEVIISEHNNNQPILAPKPTRLEKMQSKLQGLTKSGRKKQFEQLKDEATVYAHFRDPKDKKRMEKLANEFRPRDANARKIAFYENLNLLEKNVPHTLIFTHSNTVRA